ncbi:hypothetical protein L1887_58857 [Cichorium endivia]|nr:hypothetical protein L1887_58857 [Cichorium endivia]
MSCATGLGGHSECNQRQTVSATLCSGCTSVERFRCGTEALSARILRGAETDRSTQLLSGARPRTVCASEQHSVLRVGCMRCCCGQAVRAGSRRGSLKATVHQRGTSDDLVELRLKSAGFEIEKAERGAKVLALVGRRHERWCSAFSRLRF